MTLSNQDNHKRSQELKVRRVSITPLIFEQNLFSIHIS
jgi:hypothetical protein